MIKLLLGGVGSGKSVSLARYVYSRQNPVWVNFPILAKNARRLMLSHIIEKEVLGVRKNGEEVTKQKVNYSFWRENLGDSCDIVLDEAHNILMSRMSMSKNNVLITQWLAQIRKILGASEHNDIILSSQRLAGLDVIPRELCSEIIAVQKLTLKEMQETRVIKNGRAEIKMLPVVVIIQYHFMGDRCLDAYTAWKELGQKSFKYRSSFVANPFFQLYDSYELIDFGQEAYL